MGCILPGAVSESTRDTVWQSSANKENLPDTETSLSTSPPSWHSSTLNDDSVDDAELVQKMCDNELEVTQLPKKRAVAQKIFLESQKEECDVPF